ncbi:MAG: DMT family transporter [Proteobacteria bacterium]|nr:DMT family transporter [Pseudomonadota bacterium]
MTYILIAVTLLGLIHPISKLILDQGIPLSYFCILFIGIRLTILVPLASLKDLLVYKNTNLTIRLIFFGIIGALLQATEFKGIAIGLHPSTVTLLVFSYPLWIALLEQYRERTFHLAQTIQAVAIMLALSLVLEPDFSGARLFNGNYIYPVIAGILMATWITMSGSLRKQGLTPISISIFYDAFSLVALVGLFSIDLHQDWPAFAIWTSNNNHLFIMVGYSLAVGLIPNLLVYKASAQASPQVAGNLLALEPLLSIAYSTILFRDNMNANILGCAALIVIANIPPGVFQWLKTKLLSFRLKTKNINFIQEN